MLYGQIMKQDIAQTWHFSQSPQEVWEYLTNPELIEQWLMKSDFKPIAGHKFQFSFVPKMNSPYDGILHCEVLHVNPFEKLSYSWNGSTKDKKRTFNSKVVWTLIPTDHGTELQLQHEGFTILEDILNHKDGWNICVKRLEDSINSNKQ